MAFSLFFCCSFPSRAVCFRKSYQWYELRGARRNEIIAKIKSQARSGVLPERTLQAYDAYATTDNGPKSIYYRSVVLLRADPAHYDAFLRSVCACVKSKKSYRAVRFFLCALPQCSRSTLFAVCGSTFQRESGGCAVRRMSARRAMVALDEAQKEGAC